MEKPEWGLSVKVYRSFLKYSYNFPVSLKLFQKKKEKGGGVARKRQKELELQNQK